MMEVRLAETRPQTTHVSCDTRNANMDPTQAELQTYNTSDRRAAQDAQACCACVAAAGWRMRHVHAPRGAAKQLPCTTAMPRWKSSTSSGSGGSEDGSSDRRQRDHVGVLLADQLVVNELARDPSPSQTLLIRLRRLSSSDCTPWLLSM